MGNTKEYIKKLDEREEELAKQSKDLQARKQTAENIGKNLCDLACSAGISNMGHINDGFNIWGGGEYNCHPLPEDPVAAKLNLVVRLSGRPFVYRSIFASIRDKMLKRKLPFEIYDCFLKTSVEEIYSQIEALSLRPEYQTTKQKSIVKKSIKNGLVSVIAYWPNKIYDSSERKLVGIKLFNALNS